MRPDEHKKKKNADYKKKHGISAKKETKKEEIKKGKPEKPQIPETKQENIPKEPETRSFSRRKITSNWDRYEDLEYSGATNDIHQKTTGRRGADFATLVEQVGDSHSQFRFQTEKEWEEGSVDTQETQAVLKINFKDLSQSLKSLPLYKKLNLEEQEICPDLEELNCDQNTTTKEMSQLINIQEGSSESQHRNIETSHKTSSNLSNVMPRIELNNSFSLSGTDSKTSETQENTNTAASSLHQSMKSISIGKDDKTSPLNSTLDSIENVKTTTEQLEEDELDFLLSLDSGRKKNSFDSYNSSKDISNTSQTDIKKQNIEVTKGDVPKGSDSQGTKSYEQKPEEDLEDWLDSVLA